MEKLISTAIQKEVPINRKGEEKDEDDSEEKVKPCFFYQIINT